MRLGNLNLDKKAIMGIGTLIIFIATILVAAVAAGVLISTSGILQQRSLITGQEARKKITNAVEVFSVLAAGNKTDESLNDFEVLLRLDAGSDPIQMKNFHLQYIGPEFDDSAVLQHESKNDPSIDSKGYDFQPTLPLTNGTVVLLDEDMDEDRVPDFVTIVEGANDSVMDALVFNLSSQDAGEAYVYFEDKIANLSGTDLVELKLEDIPIVAQNNLTYGYFSLVGNFSNTTNGIEINSTFFTDFQVYKNPKHGCEFETLGPEKYYCYEVLTGNLDAVLGDGEVFKLKYKLREENKLYIGEDFKFIFSAQKGRLTQAQARTPDVITTTMVPLWPVG